MYTILQTSVAHAPHSVSPAPAHTLSPPSLEALYSPVQRQPRASTTPAKPHFFFLPFLLDDEDAVDPPPLPPPPSPAAAD